SFSPITFRGDHRRWYHAKMRASLGVTWALAVGLGCGGSSNYNNGNLDGNGPPGDPVGGGGSDPAGRDPAGVDLAAGPPGMGAFPSTSPWYQDVTNATLDGKSGDIISGLAGAGGWGNGNKLQIDFSIEVLSADNGVVPRAFVQTGDFYDPDCDPIPLPVP